MNLEVNVCKPEMAKKDCAFSSFGRCQGDEVTDCLRVYVCKIFFFFNGDRDTGPADCDGSLVIGNVTVPNGKATVFIFLFSSL